MVIVTATVWFADTAADFSTTESSSLPRPLRNLIIADIYPHNRQAELSVLSDSRDSVKTRGPHRACRRILRSNSPVIVPTLLVSTSVAEPIRRRQQDDRDRYAVLH